jgi:XTP/dITP diphosphohydrolase
MTTLVLATANPHKALEMEAVLATLGYHVTPRPTDVPDVEETEDTLEGNALLKARALSLATGRPAVADDTGLFVSALGGEPGVYSARYAGATASDLDNVNKLLTILAPFADRSAVFRTVIAVVRPDGREVTVVGELAGEIAPAPRGAGGFGYDPVFEVPEVGGLTLAEMTPSEKNAISHRARALKALAGVLRD